jgi:hypothetical protein
MSENYVEGLRRSRAKLVEQRRALVKRDCSHDRNEGYAERIVTIQAAIDATERAIGDEEKASANAAPLDQSSRPPKPGRNAGLEIVRSD